MQGPRRARHYKRARHLSALAQQLRDLRYLRHIDALEDRDRAIPLRADGRLERLPGKVPRRLDGLFVRRLPALELRLAGNAGLDDPVPHPGDAVELVLKTEALLRLVPLVTPARRVPLRLGQLRDVEQGRLVLPPDLLDAFRVRLDQRRVVPPPD